MKYCDSVFFFLLSGNYFDTLHQAHSITQCLQSPRKFIVATAPHRHNHQGNAATFYFLTLKSGKKMKRKQNEQMTTKIPVIHKTSRKIHPDM